MQASLSKPDGSLLPAQAGVDNACKLGQWLHGEGRKYASSPEYKTLVAEHARFPRASAGAVERVNSGQNPGADTQLGGDSEVATSSRKLATAIGAVQKRMANV